MVAKAETVKRRLISNSSWIDVMAPLSILGFRPLPLSSSSELLPPQNRLCRLKTNAHVRSSFYAVVCIILSISVDLERFCRRLSNIWAKLNARPHFQSIRWCHYKINIAKRCRQKIPVNLPSKVQMKWHVRVTSQKRSNTILGTIG